MKMTTIKATVRRTISFNQEAEIKIQIPAAASDQTTRDTARDVAYANEEIFWDNLDGGIISSVHCPTWEAAEEASIPGAPEPIEPLGGLLKRMLGKMADEARPRDAADDKSPRQIEAQNQFYGMVRRLLDDDQWTCLQANCRGATTNEEINYTLKMLGM